MPVGRRGRLRDPRDGRPRRPGDRPGRGHRAGADGRAQRRRPALRAPGDAPRRGQRADATSRPTAVNLRWAVDRVMAALRRGRRAVRGRRRDRRGDAGRGRRDRRRGDRRTTAGWPRRAGDPARRPRTGRVRILDPLQHRAARLRPVRDRPRRSSRPRTTPSARSMSGSTRRGRTCRAPGSRPGSWPRPASRTRSSPMWPPVT